MSKTLHDRYVEALKAQGSVVTPHQPSSKYTQLTRPNRDGTYYFVGRSGALRYGKNASDSFAASDKWKARLLNGGLASTATP